MSDATRTQPPLHQPEQEPGEERLADLAPWTPSPVEEGLGFEEVPTLDEELADLASEPDEAQGVGQGAQPVPAARPSLRTLSVVEAFRVSDLGLGGGPAVGSAHVEAPRLEVASEPVRVADSELEATPVFGTQGLTDLSSWAAPAPALLGRPTPPVELPLPVLVRVEQAVAASDAERPEAAARLNEVLAQLAQGGGERQVADTLHRLLDSGRLEGLVDARGRSCRAVAVEALLSLGFPYALEVQPEDLKHLRSNNASRPKGRPGALDFGPEVPALVLGGGLFAQVVEEFLRPGVVEGTVTLQVGLSVLAMLALWLAPPRTPVYRLGLGLLALVSGYGLLLALGSAGHAGGLWAGVAGAVAVLLAALRES
ncbi:hypothetical protein ACN47A_02225 [Myxococcus fulvus]|uniref:hypothetical protein n=1 Tax=Myxococcus fulvus TaxID=33 RepID=UPI003B9D79E4